MSSQNIEDEDHESRVYFRVWDNIKNKILPNFGKNKNQEMDIPTQTIKEILGYTDKKDYINQNLTVNNIENKAEQEGISYK